MSSERKRAPATVSIGSAGQIAARLRSSWRYFSRSMAARASARTFERTTARCGSSGARYSRATGLPRIVAQRQCQHAIAVGVGALGAFDQPRVVGAVEEREGFDHFGAHEAGAEGRVEHRRETIRGAQTYVGGTIATPSPLSGGQSALRILLHRTLLLM
jgi:hypothetical protein